ncbi:MAG: 3-dehydroquinate synthase II, partial [Thermoplasmata archaeon]|nr:3-dehydroquinate synthase II [Thermoplasmata archaeon]
VMIEAERSGLHPTVFLQEAETVRLSVDPPAQISSAALRPGARIWGVVLQPARHLGHVIDEAIEER